VGISTKHSIAYYISAHGYGHGVRSGQIIRAANALYPQLTIHIVSDLPFSFLTNQIGNESNALRRGSFDVGMVQLDSIRVDIDATLKRVKQLYDRRAEIVSQETDFISKNCIELVVADIPAIPIEASAMAGIPSLAIGNFGWDWIYSEFLRKDGRWRQVVEAIRREYAMTDLLLRLPFCENMNAFPNIEDIPLVASPGKNRRSEITTLMGCDPAKKWVLLSFTTLDWNGEAVSRVMQDSDCEFFTVLPLEWPDSGIHALNREQVPFSDVIASVDVVVSKPGFGILSDCIVNQKPLIYAERRDFLEYSILETAIRKYLRYVRISAVDLYRGDLRSSLDLLWQNPVPSARVSRGGDQIAAKRIAQIVEA
jgi:L-arabinokinase